MKYFKPMNKYLSVRPIPQEETKKPAVLLPADYKGNKPTYETAVVVGCSDDITIGVEVGNVVFYNSTYLEKIQYGKYEINLIAQSYILGILS